METLKEETHWTAENIDDFLYKVASDFVLQIDNYLGDGSQAELAKRLGVTASRVSQVLNNPGNISLRKMVEYSRALGKKVAVVVYDDGDASDFNGPINSQVFAECWLRSGQPTDFFAFQEQSATLMTYCLSPVGCNVQWSFHPSAKATNTATQPIGIQASASTEKITVTQ